MHIAYIAIGDELLRGESREGNAAVLSELLEARGHRLSEVRVLPDDFAEIARTLKDFQARPTLLVMSGGLGPTDDDFTRAAVAEAMNVPLIRDMACVEQIRARFASLGRVMHPANERQAEFPRGAEVLRNDHGSAPGFVLPLGKGKVACFPGVPREFRHMLADHLDDLLQGVGLTAVGRREITLRLFGIPESDMQGVLTGLPHYPAVQMRSLPKYPEIRLKLAERGDPAGFDALLAEVRQALGWHVYGEGDADSHAAATLRALQARQATVAVAESCTGGLIGHLLTEVPGSSASLLADVVAYANEAKALILHVDPALLQIHGAVSEPVARAMAEGVRHLAGSTVAVATTGIAGPGGGSHEKPVGTAFLALATTRGTQVKALRFPGVDRARFKLLVAHSALAELRRWSLES
jgi:nicotinamide-nucleotide amidase